MSGCSSTSASCASALTWRARRSSFITHSRGTFGGVVSANADTSTAITTRAPSVRAAWMGTGLDSSPSRYISSPMRTGSNCPGLALEARTAARIAAMKSTARVALPLR